MARTPITFAPLTQWPAGRPYTPAGDREEAKFVASGKVEPDPLRPGQTRFVSGKRTTLTRTLEDLDRELSAIAARDVVVQIDAANKEDFRRELRRDGQVREDARTRSPAIVVSFKRGTGRAEAPLVFACDFFKRWQDNLRAIALGLESLRRLERYHIAQTGDQYRGWQALPASTTPALSPEQAAEVLARRSDFTWSNAQVFNDRNTARDAYRRAAAKTHPDGGGITMDFQLVQEAKRVLEAHFGGPL